jgi:hypothetical protein
MSKIALEGNVSGSGTLTIAAPNTNSNFTLSLPTNTGTIITQNSTPAFASTIGVGGATPSTSGAGITFPATQSASSNANTLDDYEEGTWTPEVADATTGGNTAGGTFTGFYTKVGRLVTLNFNCGAITTGGMTSGNTLYIRNLPFVCIASANLQSVPGSVYANQLTLAAGEITMVFDVPDGESYGALRTMISASNAGTITVGDATSGQCTLRISITYTT